ncbi:hypothetical protein HDU67_007647 [Dinochytrium kinnereticum]|nr:hypothetical protein HDU67_007647 [Dinochytrium kinnereticum]
MQKIYEGLARRDDVNTTHYHQQETRSNLLERDRENYSSVVSSIPAVRPSDSGVFGGCGELGPTPTTQFKIGEQNPDSFNKEESLCPVRLDIEIDGIRIRDNFTWNVQETSITPEKFAEILCEDLNLPLPHANFATQIARAIHDHLDEFYDHQPTIYQVNEQMQDGSMETRYVSWERRVAIKLDITIDGVSLVDQFEWDINGSQNPELFADHLVSELGLCPEFREPEIEKVEKDKERDARFGNLDSKDILTLGQDGRGGKQIEAEELYQIVNFRERFELPFLRDYKALNKEDSHLKFSNKMHGIPQLSMECDERQGRIRPGLSDTQASAAVAENEGGSATAFDSRRVEIVKFVTWKCTNCSASPAKTSIIRNGPSGPRTLCDACGIYYARHGSLPATGRSLKELNPGENGKSEESLVKERTTDCSEPNTTKSEQDSTGKIRDEIQPPSVQPPPKRQRKSPVPYPYPQPVTPMSLSPVKIIEPRKNTNRGRGRPPASSTLRLAHSSSGIQPGSISQTASPLPSHQGISAQGGSMLASYDPNSTPVSSPKAYGAE